MTLRRAAWELGVLMGAALAGCGGEAFSVAPDAGGPGSGSASGSASATGSQSGASGATTGSASGSRSGAESGATTGSASGSRSGSSGAGATGSTGTSSGASGSSGTSSGTPTDAGPGVSCPNPAPNAGSLCPKVGLQCEYGSNPDLQCNQLAVCQGVSGWTYTPSSKCPSPTCPANYEQITPAGACAPLNATCAYVKGTCVCSAGSLLRSIDGSVVVDWACFPSTLACRSPRPRLGDPCVDENHTCDYGACSGGVELQCTGGLWQEVPVACPG